MGPVYCEIEYVEIADRSTMRKGDEILSFEGSNYASWERASDRDISGVHSGVLKHKIRRPVKKYYASLELGDEVLWGDEYYRRRTGDWRRLLQNPKGTVFKEKDFVRGSQYRRPLPDYNPDVSVGIGKCFNPRDHRHAEIAKQVLASPEEARETRALLRETAYLKFQRQTLKTEGLPRVEASRSRQGWTSPASDEPIVYGPDMWEP